jgi:hypothetical protein
MASSTPSLSGAEAIRSLQDDNAIFEAFDSYPWTRDPAFLSGLRAILGDPNQTDSKSSSSPSDLAIHARIFYYSQRIGVSIDFARYQSWLSSRPSYAPPQVLPSEYLSSSSTAPGKDAAGASPPPPEPLSWQSAAPKTDLYIDKSAVKAQNISSDAPGGGDDAATAGEPNYPMGFAQMLKLLQEGKPIPGIRQIPNTIAREPTTKPVGARTAPRKPWERAAVQHPHGAGLATSSLDADFPPVEADVEVQHSQGT